MNKRCAEVLSMLWPRDWMRRHYEALYLRERTECLFYQAKLFEAWKSLQQQQKGMRRMARKIERQQLVITKQKIELASLRLEQDRIWK